MQYIKTSLIDAYLDYRNDYLTYEKYAACNDLNVDDAITILNLGKQYWTEHNDFLESIKNIKGV